ILPLITAVSWLSNPAPTPARDPVLEFGSQLRTGKRLRRQPPPYPGGGSAVCTGSRLKKSISEKEKENQPLIFPLTLAMRPIPPPTATSVTTRSRTSSRSG